jgi:signal transduction histidine kinase
MSAEERRKFLANILADTGRLERLVTRILELARADSLAPRGDESCDLAQAAADMAAEARRKGQRLAVADMPATLLAGIDRASFDIVLSNLLENAQQHGGKGVSVAISGCVEGKQAVVEVRDDGVGVSKGNAGRIFDRFFTTARDSGGTGLGLAIARQRVAAFGGALALVPSERGAAFQIRLKSRPGSNDRNR